ncbi:helix-turn-helix domain-containing protein [Roseovarius sp. D0-M9]|uniref:helix-turn-helix domain-containing protein n=1 Tax=Roseovarius sp. D0-M9 TaxID=3127117 RepID=UPI00300F9451
MTEKECVARACLDLAQFRKVQRLTTYSIANTMLSLNGELQRELGLRPDAFQIYLVIAVSAVQKYARDPSDPAYHGTAPLEPEMLGVISRRSIAEITGMPRETVARHIRKLMEKGLVEDRGRGRLTTPIGVLERYSASGILEVMAVQVLNLANDLLRQGTFRIGAPISKTCNGMGQRDEGSETENDLNIADVDLDGSAKSADERGQL